MIEFSINCDGDYGGPDALHCNACKEDVLELIDVFVNDERNTNTLTRMNQAADEHRLICPSLVVVVMET